jgi:hypothetical protein
MPSLYPGDDLRHDYTQDGGASIDDSTPSGTSTYSSQKIETLLNTDLTALLSDSTVATTTTWSSQKIDDEMDLLQTDINAAQAAADVAQTSAAAAQSTADANATAIAGLSGGGTPSASTSTRLSTLDVSGLYPASMRASITDANGGTNKCWGHTMTFIAGVNLLAGRVVSFLDTAAGTDSTRTLEVEYLKTQADEDDPTHCPIGVTQNNATAGQTVEVCVRGFTSAICSNAESVNERGSQSVSGTLNQGRIRVDQLGGGNQARIGVVAQSDANASNSPVLIYVQGWFQPY